MIQNEYLLPRIAMYLKASEFIGLTEIGGEENNPQIVQFFKEIGHSWVQDDETAWCSAFLNWIALKCGCDRSLKLDARSWLGAGNEVHKPELGHIVILWREKPISWKGHTGLFAGIDDKHIHILGGNQGNQVKVAKYPKNRLLGYREVNYI